MEEKYYQILILSEQRDIKLNYQAVHGRGLKQGDL